MSLRETEAAPEITVISDSQFTTVEEMPNTAEIEPEIHVTAERKHTNGQRMASTKMAPNLHTPMTTSPVGCSTEQINRRNVPLR